MKTSDLETMVPDSSETLNTTLERVNVGLQKSEMHPLTVVGYVEGMLPPEYSRLIVLVPDRDVDETVLARKIWALLSRRRASVLFVTLVTDSNYGPSAHRRLVTLAAITQDKFNTIETRLIFGHSWIPGLREIVQPGDLIVCHDSQQTRSFLHKDEPLADLVLTRLQTPTYRLSGLYPETITPHPSRVLRQIVFWGLLIGILGGFFVFEADIDHLTTGWVSTLLFILVFIVELLLIWMWNFLRI